MAVHEERIGPCKVLPYAIRHVRLYPAEEKAAWSGEGTVQSGMR